MKKEEDQAAHIDYSERVDSKELLNFYSYIFRKYLHEFKHILHSFCS